MRVLIKFIKKLRKKYLFHSHISWKSRIVIDQNVLFILQFDHQLMIECIQHQEWN